MELERKFSPMSGKIEVTDRTTITGYASLFGAPDQGGDVVELGAFRASLADLKARNMHVKMLWQHDPTQPIGVWDEVREDAKGLFVRGRILTDVEKGREAAALIAAGVIDGLSIGYRTRRATKDDRGQRHLSELELWEVSLVTFPMLPEARVAAKGEEPFGWRSLRDLAAAFRAASEELARD